MDNAIGFLDLVYIYVCKSRRSYLLKELLYSNKFGNDLWDWQGGVHMNMEGRSF